MKRDLPFFIASHADVLSGFRHSFLPLVRWGGLHDEPKVGKPALEVSIFKTTQEGNKKFLRRESLFSFNQLRQPFFAKTLSTQFYTIYSIPKNYYLSLCIFISSINHLLLCEEMLKNFIYYIISLLYNLFLLFACLISYRYRGLSPFVQETKGKTSAEGDSCIVNLYV